MYYVGGIRVWECYGKHMRHNKLMPRSLTSIYSVQNNTPYNRRNPNCLYNLSYNSMPSFTTSVSTLENVPTNLETPEQHKTTAMCPKQGSNYRNKQTPLVSVIKSCDYFKMPTGEFPVLLVRTALQRLCLVCNKISVLMQ